MARRSRGRRRISTAPTAPSRSSASTSTASSPAPDVVIDDTVVGWPARSLKDIPPGDYFVQALINRYETFHRADGHTIKMPMDQGEGQHWDSKPGNFYSKPVKMHLDAGERRRDQDLDGPGDSADRAADGHRAGEVPPRAERSADEVLGPADVSRRDRVPAAGLGRASQRALSAARPPRPLSRRTPRATAGARRRRTPARPARRATTRWRRTSSTRTGTARSSRA